MKIIVVVDDSYGMMFNKRRQSRDKVLCEKVATLVSDNVLWMNAYTHLLFNGMDLKICVDEEFLSKVELGEYCFVEDKKVSSYINQVEEIVIFHWNRKYPSDLKLDFIPEKNNFVCVDVEEFVGNSHEQITMERWKRTYGTYSKGMDFVV